MQSVTDKLRAFVFATSLDEKQRAAFYHVLRRLPHATQEFMLELFSRDPRYVRKLYRNFVQKKEALLTHDHRRWNAIVREERVLIDAERS